MPTQGLIKTFMDCIFCKIVGGELPSHKVYEDDEFLAFLDIGPVRAGHTLVIPREHHETFLALPSPNAGKLWQVAQKVAKAVVKATNAQGCNLSVNNGRAGGQVVFHVHVHIIPRVESDGLTLWPQGKYETGEAEAVAEKIKQAF